LNNNDIVRSLEMIVTLMQIKDEAYYRWLGYQRAAASVQALGRPAAEVEDLKTLPHDGATTAEVIRDLAEDRTPQLLVELTEEIRSGSRAASSSTLVTSSSFHRRPTVRGPTLGRCVISTRPSGISAVRSASS
jgi:DNA polymerase/3'-5' exonuclease PolX